MIRPLQLPDPEKVSPRRAAAVFKRLGLDWAAAPHMLMDPIPRIVPLLPTGGTAWWVGDKVVVTYQGKPEDFPHKGHWASDDASGVPAHSPAVATAIMVHAWNDARLRPLFEHPAWALDLEPLVGTGQAADPEGVPHGFVRYHLDTGGPGGRRLPIRRELVRLSRRDGRPLRPYPIDDAAESLAGRVQGLTPADLAFHRARQLHSWVERHSVNADGDGARIGGELAAECFARLMEVDELTYGAQPLRPDPEPFVPVLTATDGDEGIDLAWAEEVVDTYDAGPGYVVTADDRLRPLDAPTLSFDPHFLLRALPKVPFAEADAFLERFVRHSGVTLLVDSSHLPRSRGADAILGLVRLAEHDDDLVVDLAFGYRLGEDIHERNLDERGSHVSVGGVLLARDGAAERRLRASLEHLLGRPVPTRLRGDKALDFLVDGPIALGPQFRFFGTDDLRRHRVVGDFTARVAVPSGVDWLDLRVRFAVGDQEVEGAAVIESWRRGDRYHRLPDGTLARLPEDWLAKHGEVAAELEEMRSAHGGRLSPFAAPLVAPLLDEAEGAGRWRAVLSRLGDVDGLPERDVPAELNADLRSYQHTGFRWLSFLRDLGLGACLADDMGLGKTVQAITTLLDTHRPGGVPHEGSPSLVVAPTSVVHNWAEELRKFAPVLRVAIHHGPDRAPEKWPDVDIVITSYALLRLDADAFKSQPWRIAILDEAQHIKNPDSLVARTARALPTEHRVALTGTPLENHLIELWSVFEFLMPGFFGSRAAFIRRYAQPIQRDREIGALRALRRRLGPFVLRRHKSEVARELPPRQEQVLYCELGPDQRALYERVKATYRDAVLGRVDRDGLGAATLSVLEALMRLRQACCDPGLLPFPEAAEVKGSAKRDLLLETLEEVVETGHRALIFSQWPSLLKRVRRYTDVRGWQSLYLDGSTIKRHELVDKWNDPEGPPLFFISLKAGGSGLNLTGADHVIHLDPWWNPAVEDQATDRAHRIGQTRPVVAYKLVARDTVEEKILELQARKRALFEATVEQERTLAEQLTRADLEAVFAPHADDEDDGFVPLSGEEIELIEPESRPPLAIAPPVITLRGPGAGVLPDPLQRRVNQGDLLTNALVREAMGWSADEARRWLREQVDTGNLEQRGRKRGTHYVVAATAR